jgi:hypothetical protein
MEEINKDREAQEKTLEDRNDHGDEGKPPETKTVKKSTTDPEWFIPQGGSQCRVCVENPYGMCPEWLHPRQ